MNDISPPLMRCYKVKFILLCIGTTCQFFCHVSILFESLTFIGLFLYTLTFYLYHNYHSCAYTRIVTTKQFGKAILGQTMFRDHEGDPFHMYDYILEQCVMNLV